eukprot:CAMPEP_0172092470 /NCGR_PEP_ID=MMETSP1043-20130122/25456_1 /TAXON_ID=464988 /ORGANISM="Hemiselmis andersenii, Strain CCMP441" /LENGTH=32 /DNA_ID= /DNA_START= /DNA_END= /DNA_ORIENTATION=
MAMSVASTSPQYIASSTLHSPSVLASSHDASS